MGIKTDANEIIKWAQRRYANRWIVTDEMSPPSAIQLKPIRGYFLRRIKSRGDACEADISCATIRAVFTLCRVNHRIRTCHFVYRERARGEWKRTRRTRVRSSTGNRITCSLFKFVRNRKKKKKTGNYFVALRSIGRKVCRRVRETGDFIRGDVQLKMVLFAIHAFLW